MIKIILPRTPCQEIEHYGNKHNRTCVTYISVALFYIGEIGLFFLLVSSPGYGPLSSTTFCVSGNTTNINRNSCAGSCEETTRERVTEPPRYLHGINLDCNATWVEVKRRRKHFRKIDLPRRRSCITYRSCFLPISFVYVKSDGD